MVAAGAQPAGRTLLPPPAPPPPLPAVPPVPVLPGHWAALAAQVFWSGHTTWVEVQPQTPAEQIWVELQTVPQPPQFEAFMLVSTHEPPQSIWPVGQPHWPPLQLRPVGHAIPQLPQLSWLVWRSTQLFPQAVCPPVQFAVQLAWLQNGVEPLQVLVHEPQCCGSDEMSMQLPLQFWKPDLHWQAPPEQTSVAWQLWPHAPQLSASADTSTHIPLHRSFPGGH